MPHCNDTDKEEVERWLWQIDKGPGLILKKHGQKMLDKHFESKEAAELFVLHDLSRNELVDR